MARNPSGDDPTATAFYNDVDGDLHHNGATYFGADTAEGAAVTGVYDSGTIVVAVPNITDPDCAKVDVDISALTFAAAVGDAVIARPSEALPTNCRLGGAWVSATDQITITFSSEGGNVTGANKNFKFLIFDLT